MKSDTLGSLKQASWQFWLLSAFLALVFLTGGSSRGDVQSLAVLRPAAALVLGVGLLSIKRDDIHRYRALFTFTGTIIVLIAIYLVPMPLQISSRELAFDTGLLSYSDQIMRPMTLISVQTWNSFFALIVPVAVLFLAVQLNKRDQSRLLTAMLALILLSGLIGLAQTLGHAHGPLYFYRITNNGAAVGFFANRNHQAILLVILFPILAVFASIGARSAEQAVFRGYICIAIGIFLIPLLLVTGSRAGLILGIFAIAAALLLYRKPKDVNPPKRKSQEIDWRIPLAGVGVFAMGLVTLLVSRAEAIDRLFGENNASESRREFWSVSIDLANNYLPMGIGPGSIAEAYSQIEPLDLTDNTYLNHIHNDWLEFYVSFGLLGLIILISSVVAVMYRGWTIALQKSSASKEVIYRKLGLVIIFIIALASIFDYPVRTPIVSAVCVIALVWLNFKPRESAGSELSRF